MGLATYLLFFIGVPYVWGGNNVSIGVDCSGLLSEGFKAMGYMPWNADRSSQMHFDNLKSSEKWEMYYPGTTVFQDDVLVFGSSENNITHISVAVDGERMVEAGGGNRNTDTVKEAKKRNAMVRVRPISNRTDLIAVFRRK